MTYFITGIITGIIGNIIFLFLKYKAHRQETPGEHAVRLNNISHVVVILTTIISGCLIIAGL